MKFGKVEDITGIDFGLPDDHPNNERRLNSSPKTTDKKWFFLGSTAWSNKSWKGIIYPPGSKTNEFLQAYGKQFNTIELNSTHYRIPTFEMIQNWKDSVPEDFVFCPKMLQRISHARNLSLDTELPETFANAISAFGSKQGPCFIQLPPYFGPDKFEILADFIERHGRDFDLALELRHSSWFENTDSFDSVLTLLNANNSHVVVTDVAGRRDVLHMALTSRTLLIRFVGNNGNEIDYARVDDWVNKLKRWWNMGLERVFFFLHQDEPTEFIKLAQYLLDSIEHLKLDVTLRKPKPVPGGQGTLF